MARLCTGAMISLHCRLLRSHSYPNGLLRASSADMVHLWICQRRSEPASRCRARLMRIRVLIWLTEFLMVHVHCRANLRDFGELVVIALLFEMKGISMS